TGRITIERDGTVSGWELDHRDELPHDVAELIDEDLPLWRFEPIVVDGQPVRGSARMRLGLQARQLADRSFGAFISDGVFGRAALTREERKARGLDGAKVPDPSIVTSLDITPPKYPREAALENFRGTVFLALRVNRSGTVDDVVVE